MAGIAEPGRTAVPERDRILTTKVKIPPTRHSHLNRSRLIDTLDSAVRRDLTLVSAPAGFGKTTLLTDWAIGAALPVAWLSLDKEDGDPARFWRYFLASLDRASIDAEEPRLSQLIESGGASSEGMAAALIQDLEDLDEDLVVVLDDYQEIDSQGVHDGMTFLVNHQPPRLHVVVSSRADPPLPVARMRANDQLAEIRAADLRFTSEESRAFLEELWELDVEQAAATTLHHRTEGWAVGLQLAALSLKDRDDREAFMEAFTGTHRYVLDYLSEEVFEGQSAEVQEFLLMVSILERLTGSLCDAVTGQKNGQDMLEDLDRANLFVVPLDEERGWYRFHRLFRDVLSARLQQTAPESVPELHRRAGAWCAENGLIDEAIHHVLACGEPAWAAELVEDNLNMAFNRGEGGTVVKWLSLLPDELVQSRVRLGIARAMMAWHVYRVEEMDQTLDHVERALAKTADVGEGSVPTEGGMVSDVTAAIALLRGQGALVIIGDTAMARKHLETAQSRFTDHETGPKFWVEWLQVSADYIDGRAEHVEPIFAQMLAEGRATPNPHPLMIGCTTLGKVREARGMLGAALSNYEDGLRFAKDAVRFSPFHVGEAHLGQARVLFQRNDLDGALGHATQGVELARQVVEYLLLGIGLQTLAWIRHARGDWEEAREAMEESTVLIPRPNVASVVYPGHAGRAKLHLAQGNAEPAERFVERQGLGVEDDITFNREENYLVLARLLMAQGDTSRALELLSRMDALAGSQGRYGNLFEIRVLKALALDVSGDHDKALGLLADTLTRAAPEGYVRVFVDEGPPMASLLRRLAGVGKGEVPRMSSDVRGHLNTVLRACRPIAGVPRDEGPAVWLPHPLTDRELEVLQLLAAGRRNREIAEELYVSVDTVKKHVSHILDKLAASNRTEAVAEAVSLGILSPSG
jgi:LuxR family maltose regulon positive regulatory protein